MGASRYAQELRGEIIKLSDMMDRIGDDLYLLRHRPVEQFEYRFRQKVAGPLKSVMIQAEAIAQMWEKKSGKQK